MSNMHSIVVTDERSFARAGADLIADTIRRKPDASVLPATGNTPMAIYDELARRCAAGLDSSRLRVINLDEYVGVERSDPRSLRAWLERSFVEPMGVDTRAVIAFDSMAPDLAAECARFDRAVDDGDGIDLAILGLGPNGHLGFNEPPSGLDAPTRVVDLAPASLASNSAYWDSGDEVPSRALTLGMARLLSARRVLLVVAGAHKREILRRAFEGRITEYLPASFLQLHPDCVVLADAAAAGST